MAGRKSLKEEINVVQYMSELAPKTFKFINECFDGDSKQDKKWAGEQMMKLYAKAIEPGNDPNNPIVVYITKELAEKNGINQSNSSTIDNSEGPSPIPSS